MGDGTARIATGRRHCGNRQYGKWGNTMSSRQIAVVAALFFSGVAVSAFAEPNVMRDLAPLHPKQLSKEQLEHLLPGAKMSRKVYTGSTNYWTNEPDGKFVVSTDNRGRIGTGAIVSHATAPGTWHISSNGRYCVTIEWKNIPTEKWCRHVFETSEGYYASKSDRDANEKVHRLVINGR
jgi:hypothetical protein